MNRLPEQANHARPFAKRVVPAAKGAGALAAALALIGVFLIGVQMLSTAPTRILQSISASAPIQPLSQVLCVDDSGGTTGAPCANPTAFTRIQDAIGTASAGDEVRVAAGTYVTNTGTTVVTLDRAITLTGGYPGGVSGWTTPGDETQTVIDGQGVRDGISVSVGSGNIIVAQNLSDRKSVV